MSTEVRVRFAPSPTGYLHIGGIRTALYNYLFAKKKKGHFILRIEDTDSDRSKKEYSKAILDGMKWLGLDWDEGPFYQSERMDMYRQKLEFLKEKGKAYKCFCQPDVLKAERARAIKEGRPAVYSGKCLSLSPEKIKEKESSGLKPAWRFKTPAAGRLGFKDEVKGLIEVDCGTIGDFVIVRSDNMPTYNFTCVVDDTLMGISHVIRGDDHVSNTPRQLLLYKEMGKDAPTFAHLPQVHGQDGKRLSKRSGAVSLSHYINKGYLPQALLNYLALLGWSTEDSQQLFEKNELIDKFSLERISPSPGIFDQEKLNWINGKVLRELPAREISFRAAPWLKKEGLIEGDQNIPSKIVSAIELEKDKLTLLSDIPGKIDFMFKENIIYEEKAVKKRLKKEGTRKLLEEVLDILEEIEPFNSQTLEEQIRGFAREKQIGMGKLSHPLRVAVSGKMQGPGLFKLLEFVGREKIIKRIKYTIKEFCINE